MVLPDECNSQYLMGNVVMHNKHLYSTRRRFEKKVFFLLLLSMLIGCSSRFTYKRWREKIISHIYRGEMVIIRKSQELFSWRYWTVELSILFRNESHFAGNVNLNYWIVAGCVTIPVLRKVDGTSGCSVQLSYEKFCVDAADFQCYL